MANKNTIQTIPLTGNLDMNTLRTEIRQFEGFNEKNSTVFGGTLSPLYDTTKDLYSSDNSYTVFNSKGSAFSLKKSEDGTSIELYKDENLVSGISGTYVTDTVELTVPDNTVVAISCPDDTVMAVTKDGKVYKAGEVAAQFDISNIIEAQIWYVDDITFSDETHHIISVIAAMTNNQCQVIYQTSDGYTNSSAINMKISVQQSFMTPLIVGGYNSFTDQTFNVYFEPTSGRDITKYERTSISIDSSLNFTNSSDVYIKTVEDIDNPGFLDSDTFTYSDSSTDPVVVGLELQQCALRYVKRQVINDGKGSSYKYLYSDSYSGAKDYIIKVGSSGLTDVLPECALGPWTNRSSIYYTKGSLLSIGRREQCITMVANFNKPMISFYSYGGCTYISYQTADGTWYTYKELIIDSLQKSQDYLKNMIVDEKYIFFKKQGGLTVYDIEKEHIDITVGALDWINSTPPLVSQLNTTVTTTPGSKVISNPYSYKIRLTTYGWTTSSGALWWKTWTLHLRWGVSFIGGSLWTDPYWDHTVTVETYVNPEIRGSTITTTTFTISKGSQHSTPTVVEKTYDILSDLNKNNVFFKIKEVSNSNSIEGGTSEKLAISKKSTSYSFDTTVNGTYYTTEDASTSTEYEVVPSTTGITYAAATNAGYTISGAHFIGLQYPMCYDSYFPVGLTTIYPTVPDTVQYYLSTGNSVKSAAYVGNDAQYATETYSIDSNNNMALPISVNSKILPGYSNNDMVTDTGTTYPLIYYNNNQKIYAYYLLAAVENMKGVFSLQGQSYTYDDDNIYSTVFDSGVIQSVTPVCYKKNMTYMGALPGQAVFYSAFNKTFYAFTGDRILSKMFEASYINEIKYVGQNPASLSLWICTDKGIYILSDSDMFKMDFISNYVSFHDKSAIIVTEEADENGETISEIHAVSLYKTGDDAEMIPVKLETAFYGPGSEAKAVMDCWYIRLFDEDKTEGDVKVKVNTITDVTRTTEEKTFHINPSDYDSNNIVYLRYQPKYQDCVGMQLALESPIGIYSLALGVNTTDAVPQVSKMNF